MSHQPPTPMPPEINACRCLPQSTPTTAGHRNTCRAESIPKARQKHCSACPHQILISIFVSHHHVPELTYLVTILRRPPGSCVYVPVFWGRGKSIIYTQRTSVTSEKKVFSAQRARLRFHRFCFRLKRPLCYSCCFCLFLVAPALVFSGALIAIFRMMHYASCLLVAARTNDIIFSQVCEYFQGRSAGYRYRSAYSSSWSSSMRIYFCLPTRPPPPRPGKLLWMKTPTRISRQENAYTIGLIYRARAPYIESEWIFRMQNAKKFMNEISCYWVSRPYLPSDNFSLTGSRMCGWQIQEVCFWWGWAYSSLVYYYRSDWVRADSGCGVIKHVIILFVVWRVLLRLVWWMLLTC